MSGQDDNSGKIEVSSSKPVDIDSMEVSVLLIVKSRSQFGAITQYLERRNWKVQVISDMGEAITRLAKFQPDFVFISFNHPNPKLLKLPTVLTQTFNTHCVGFCETPDLRTESKLTSSKIKYKLVGAASGPSIQRRVKQILAEQYGVADQGDPTALSKNSFSDESNGGIGTVKISGGSQPVKGLAYIPSANNKKNEKDGISLLNQLKKAMAENEESEENSTEDSETEPTKGLALTEKNSKNQIDESIDSYRDKKTDKDFFTTEDEPSSVDYNSDKNNLAKGGAILQKGQKSETHLTLQEGEEEDMFHMFENEEETNIIGPQEDPQKQTQTSVVNEDKITLELSKKNFFSEELIKDESLNHSAIELALEKNNLENKNNFLHWALKKALSQMLPSERQEDLDFKKVKRLGVIPVFDDELNGFIFVASTVSKNFELNALNQFRITVIDQIINQGEKLHIGESIEIGIKAVDIVDWTELRAEVVLVGKLGRGYVLAAFLKKEFILPELNFDKEKNKFIIPFDLTWPSTELKFSTTIFMDVNNKFISYSKPGRKLTDKQIENLVKNGKKLYIDKNEINKFHAYYIENMVNRLIENFHNREIAKEKIGKVG